MATLLFLKIRNFEQKIHEIKLSLERERLEA